MRELLVGCLEHFCNLTGRSFGRVRCQTSLIAYARLLSKSCAPWRQFPIRHGPRGGLARGAVRLYKHTETSKNLTDVVCHAQLLLRWLPTIMMRLDLLQCKLACRSLRHASKERVIRQKPMCLALHRLRCFSGSNLRTNNTISIGCNWCLTAINYGAV
jgi:hypothetical protein